MDRHTYSDLLRSLAKQLDENEDDIKGVCSTLLNIILSEMTINSIISFIAIRYLEKLNDEN